MGRKKNNSEKNVEALEVSKEEQLEAFVKKSDPVIPKEIVDKFEIKPVSRPPNMKGKSIGGFSGKDYEDSLNIAYAWMNSVNKGNARKVEIIDYYPQATFGKSILFSYNETKIIEGVQDGK